MLDDTVDASTVTRQLDGCPVKCFTVFDDQDAGRYWQEADALREETPAFFNAHAQGYWVVTRYDAIKDLYQNVDLFSSESFTAWEPNPPYRFVPDADRPARAHQVPPAAQPEVLARRRRPRRGAGTGHRPPHDRRDRGDGRVRLRHRVRHPLPDRGVPHRHRPPARGRRPPRAVGRELLPRPERRRGQDRRHGRRPRRHPRLLRRRHRRPARHAPGDPETDLVSHLLASTRRRRAADRHRAPRHVHGARARRARHDAAASSGTCSSTSPSTPTCASRSSTTRR